MRSVRVGLCTCPPGAPAVTEDRLEAIRQRHGHRTGYVSDEPMCECDEPWYECDTAQVLAALAAVTEERDAARADAERLFPFARHHFGCAVGRGAPHACVCGWDEAAAAHRSLR